jgi:hypothetical protein
MVAETQGKEGLTVPLVPRIGSGLKGNLKEIKKV